MLKKILSAAAALTLALGATAQAFTFPTPDWGALLSEKKAMVTQTDFELYVESTTGNAPYYGAKFEPKNGVYIGSVPENAQGILPLGSYLTYVEDMWQDDLYYPANQMIRNDNVMPMIGWTIHNMDNVNYDQVRKVLDTLNGYGKPMFIRFANEMNCSSLGDNPDRYIEIFRKVANMIHEYPNFAVVWSPNDMGALDRPFEYFYPGDEYVDWVGASCYMIRYFQGNKNTSYNDSVYFMTGDYSWATNRIKPLIEFMEKNNIKKPVMISEGGVATATAHGDDMQSWADPRLRNMYWNLIMKFPQIKMINYFNVHRDNENETFDISNFPYAVDIFNNARNSGAYITEYNGKPEFVFKKANEGGTLVAKDGKIKLYTMAHFPNQTGFSVNYSLDGKWHHSSDKIPYTCNLNVANLSDGKHTITISSFDKENTYTFYKNGTNIRFGAEPEAPKSEIKVTVDGREVAFDQPPIIENDRTLVPFRAIFEALGATVGWDGDTKTVSASKGDTKISLKIGDNKMNVNAQIKTLDVPAQVKNDRTLVPVRAISEALKCNVQWNGDTKTVIITQ